MTLQASVLGHGGEIFVLDMGEPVRILDLATNLINLAGLKPGRDLQIVYTGMHPGEKLDEELFLPGEIYQRTRHSKIFMTSPETGLEAELLEQVALELVHLAWHRSSEFASEQLQSLLLNICSHVDKYPPLFLSPLYKPLIVYHSVY